MSKRQRDEVMATDLKMRNKFVLDSQAIDKIIHMTPIDLPESKAIVVDDLPECEQQALFNKMRKFWENK